MRAFPAVILLAASLLASACTTDNAAEPAATKVTYLTSFNTFGRDAYAYVAQEKSYFRDAGLDVTITPGTGTVDVLKLVASGRAAFGIGDFSATAITAAKEKLPVTAVAMVHQRSLSAIVALAGKGITKPADLVGKKIADQPGSTNQVTFPAYAAAAGIPADQVTFVPAAPPALPRLLAAGQVDGIGQFVVGTPLIEKAAGGTKAVVLPYGDFLPDLYGNALLTSKDLAGKDPALVGKFRDALLKGLQYAIEHADETGQILKKYQPTQDSAVAAAEVGLMASYVKPADFAGPIGAVDRTRVDQVLKTLTGPSLIPAGSLTADDIVSFALTPKP